MDSRVRHVLGVLVAMAFIACESAVPAPPNRPPTRPPLPAGWTTTTVDGGDLRLTLPPWIVPFDTVNGLFANEVPDPGTREFLELLAEGPRVAMPQPGAGESLEAWLETHIESAGPGQGTTHRIDLPAGSGVVIDRTVRAGTPQAYRFQAFAIGTPWGVSYLLIDGPVTRWTGREDDIGLIPLLMELGPGG